MKVLSVLHAATFIFFISALGNRRNSAALAIKYKECDFVLRYVEGFGIGVYAGKFWNPDEVIEQAIGIPTPKYATYGNELDNYVEGHNETHDMITLGTAMIYNHAPESDGIMIRKATETQHPKLSFGQSNNVQKQPSFDMLYVSNWAIFPGDQLFNFYGNLWFRSRGLAEISTRRHSNREVIHHTDVQSAYGRIPGCPTLLTRISNNRLVAAVDIEEGEYIEVARALLLPAKYQRDTILLEKFLWWRSRTPAKPKGKKVRRNHHRSRSRGKPPIKINTKYEAYNSSGHYSLLLLGNGALYGGIQEGTGQIANVQYSWWDFSIVGAPWYVSDHQNLDPVEANYNLDVLIAEDGTSQMYSKNSQLVSLGPSRKRSKNGILCNTRMFVSFIASRKIKIGDELIIDLQIDSVTGRRYASHEFASQCL